MRSVLLLAALLHVPGALADPVVDDVPTCVFSYDLTRASIHVRCFDPESGDTIARIDTLSDADAIANPA